MAGIGVTRLDHVNVTVPRELEAAAKEFYGSILGLHEVAKPRGSAKRGGAWYQIGAVQVHLSIEDAPARALSRRHVCVIVPDLGAAERHLQAAGVEVLADDQPIPGVSRFYVRDPGGNRIEIVEQVGI
jgi:catechol 2,3-dioxygenase-like lactoylglutathione lyase family enzyme